MKGYDMSGNPTVIKLASVEITGNVVPLEWFNHIKRPNGKPYTDAIFLLSDIVYWYRPIEVRDELTGKLLGLRKKFKADKLQRDYNSFAEQYGYTKNQVRDALGHLEKVGLIDLDFRHITVNGKKLGNVLFIGLNSDALMKITTLSDLKLIGCEEISQDPPDFKADTNTETTTETTTEKGADAPDLDLSIENQIFLGKIRVQVSKREHIKNALRDYFKLTPRWTSRSDREWLEWAYGEGMTPEQVQVAADRWRKDRRFNWAPPSLKGIAEHWLELVDNVITPNLDGSALERLEAGG
jgi:hypothetical protein